MGGVDSTPLRPFCKGVMLIKGSQMTYCGTDNLVMHVLRSFCVKIKHLRITRAILVVQGEITKNKSFYQDVLEMVMFVGMSWTEFSIYDHGDFAIRLEMS